MLFKRRDTLKAILRLWRPSLLAGLAGAAASEFWFLAFALATAASVRTLALIEIALRPGRVALCLQEQNHAARGAGHRGPDLTGAIWLVRAQP